MLNIENSPLGERTKQQNAKFRVIQRKKHAREIGN